MVNAAAEDLKIKFVFKLLTLLMFCFLPKKKYPLIYEHKNSIFT